MLEHYILKLASKRYDIDCFIIESLPHHFMKKNFKLFPTVFCSESLILIFTRNALYLWVACFNFMSRRSNLQIGEQNNCILSTTFFEEKLKKKFSAVALKNLQIDGNTQFNRVPLFKRKHQIVKTCYMAELLYSTHISYGLWGSWILSVWMVKIEKLPLFELSVLPTEPSHIEPLFIWVDKAQPLEHQN